MEKSEATEEKKSDQVSNTALAIFGLIVVAFVASMPYLVGRVHGKRDLDYTEIYASAKRFTEEVGMWRDDELRPVIRCPSPDGETGYCTVLYGKYPELHTLTLECNKYGCDPAICTQKEPKE